MGSEVRSFLIDRSDVRRISGGDYYALLPVRRGDAGLEAGSGTSRRRVRADDAILLEDDLPPDTIEDTRGLRWITLDSADAPDLPLVSPLDMGLDAPGGVLPSGSASPGGSAADAPVIGESRLPMAIAVLVLMAAALIAPPRLTIMPGWLLASAEGLLLIALIVGDPGRIDRTGPWQRRTSIALVVLILASTLGSTALLVYDLMTGSPLTNQADLVLVAGAKVWLGNNVAFAFVYWQFTDGGPAVRAHGLPRFPDLAFPQQLNPELARPGWRPEFLDYLYVAFTTANAFSPTDTMPMVHWVKVAMGSQALISFVVVGLVLARAVNAFT